MINGDVPGLEVINLLKGQFKMVPAAKDITGQSLPSGL